MVMKRLKITTGGQVSLPAEIRHRWGTSTVVLEDRGDEVVMRPAEDDPIVAVRGRFADVPVTSDELRRRGRQEDAEAEARRWT
jgi:AbrB family looped-hinge helix DNA binding protein